MQTVGIGTVLTFGAKSSAGPLLPAIAVRNGKKQRKKKKKKNVTVRQNVKTSVLAVLVELRKMC